MNDSETFNIQNVEGLNVLSAEKYCAVDIVANNPVAQSYTDFTEGYFVSLARSVVTLVDLFATSSLSENVPLCVANEPRPILLRATA